jgi:hypothetical protein
MSKTKELDRIAFDVSNEITEKLYKVTDYHLSRWCYEIDLDMDSDDYNDAHEYIMNQVINRFIQK